MKFSLDHAEMSVLPMRTRFPFRYGIASLSALPHVFLTVRLVVDGQAVTGISSEGLAPKWFTKNPDSSLECDVAEMLAVIQNALRIGQNAAAAPTNFFNFWRNLYDEQRRWAATREIAPLLANLGVSLVERAILQALCQAAGQPLHRLLRTDALGIELGSVRRSLRGLTLAEVLPPTPQPAVYVRHTVGLGDPLFTSDIPDGEEVNDGLPQSLEDSIRAYGLRCFKIKLSGQLDADLDRLQQLTHLLTRECPQGFQVTLDGNEQFQDLAVFQEFYRALESTPGIQPLFANLVLIEQPLHRSIALDSAVLGDQFQKWKDGPPVIIDESDGSLEDLTNALALGYRGTSHKNCKGIVKSLANAGVIYQQRSLHPDTIFHLSGEDLAGVGPVAMLQDLAMAALLGLSNVERNGHHYFKGLSMFPEAIQESLLAAHPDLYHRQPEGYAALRVRNGLLSTRSVNEAPFGFSSTLPPDGFEGLNTWIKRGGISEL